MRALAHPVTTRPRGRRPPPQVTTRPRRRHLAPEATRPRRSRPPRQVLIRRWVVLLAAVAALVIVISLVASSGGSKPRHAGSSKPASKQTGSTRNPPPSTRPSSPKLDATVASWHLTLPTSRAVVLADGSDILVLSGLTTGDVSSAAVERLQPNAGLSGVAGELSIAVHDAAGAELGSHFVVFGGGAGSSLASVQSWTRTSSSVIGALPVARSDLSAATVGSKAYLLGGFDGQTLQNEVLSTSDGVTFRDAGTLQQPVRYGAVASSGGNIWIIGGQLGTSESSSVGGQTNDIQVFDPRTGTTRVIGHLPEPLGQAVSFDLDRQLYVAGGQSGGVPSPKIWLVEPNGAVRSAGKLPYAVTNAGAVVIGSTAWIIGGESAAGPSAPLKSVIEIHAAGR